MGDKPRYKFTEFQSLFYWILNAKMPQSSRAQQPTLCFNPYFIGS